MVPTLLLAYNINKTVALLTCHLFVPKTKLDKNNPYKTVKVRLWEDINEKQSLLICFNRLKKLE